MLRRVSLIVLAAFAVLTPARASGREDSLAAYHTVEIAPTWTSIYIGGVSLTLPPLRRQGSTYEATYVARVFPFFFANEAGRLRVELSDEQLLALARGETVEFKGRGVREDGAERRVEGKATPQDARSGRLKVRVFVSPGTELIFNTTYRFSAPPSA